MINLQSPSAVGFSAKRLERIKPVMQSYVDKSGYAGIVTMLARRGQVIYFDKVGWQNRENKVLAYPLRGTWGRLLFDLI